VIRDRKGWPERLVEASVVLLLCAIAVSWAWRLVGPLVPVLVVIGIVVVTVVVGQAVRRWRRSYW
jgi:hypothetical protein